MRLLEINSVCGIRSTGRIATEIAKKYQAEGWECKIAYGREEVPKDFTGISYKIGTKTGLLFNTLMSRLFDNEGFNAKRQTRIFLKWASDYDPDVLWLHNLHGYYLNIELLFAWIKSRPSMKVYWTLHDCWAFTGHCSYFSYVKCDKWKNECSNCKRRGDYPSSWIIDQSKKNYEKKKTIFSNVKNLTIITPSEWLAGLVKMSFLSEYDIEIRNNSIDTNIFKPTWSNFRRDYHLENDKILLGVASAWDYKKGLFDFYRLALLLPPSYAVVLVGLTEKQINEAVRQMRSISKDIETDAYDRNCSIIKSQGLQYKITDYKKIRELSYSIGKMDNDENSTKGFKICISNGVKLVLISRTNSAKELAGIYSAADLFLNLTYEDNYPTVNLESQACGTECITYKSGGSVESVYPENIINAGDFDGLMLKILEKTKNMEI